MMINVIDDHFLYDKMIYSYYKKQTQFVKKDMVIECEDDDWCIYSSKVSNPLNCKNVIRLILSPISKEDFDTYLASDHIICDNFDYLPRNTLMHPNLIDSLTIENYDNSKFLLSNEFPVEVFNSIRKIDEIINRKCFLQNVQFTDPFINITNPEGVKANTIIIDQKIKLPLSIEIDFVAGDEEEKLITLNNIHLSTSNLYVNKRVIPLKTSVLNKLKLQFLPDCKLLVEVNNNISAYDILPQELYYSNLIVHKLLASMIYSIKLFNYIIPIFYNKIQETFKSYDVFRFSHPKKIYQNFLRNDKIQKTFIGMTLKNATININFHNAKQCIIFKTKSIEFNTLSNSLELTLYNNKYSYPLLLNTNYDLIFTINTIAKESYIKLNDHIYEITNIPDSLEFDEIESDALLNKLDVSNFDVNNYLRFNQTNYDQFTNLFYTFGFIKLDNLLINQNEKLIKAFEYNMNTNSMSVSDYIPSAMEYINEFVQLMLNKNIHKMLEHIFKGDYYYNGSDSKIYSSDTNWHCDRKTKKLHLKVACYLDKLKYETGALNVLPGSQNNNDIYSKILGKKAIPLFRGPGGFDKDFFKNSSVPFYTINNDFGDVVIFNLHLYHAAFNNHCNKKMICMNYARCYDDNNDEEKLECINTDCYIIGNLRKSLDLKKTIMPVVPTFYSYIKNKFEYEKYFCSLLENNNNLDHYIRLLKSAKEEDKKQLSSFATNTNNTNTKKDDMSITVYDDIIF